MVLSRVASLQRVRIVAALSEAGGIRNVQSLEAEVPITGPTISWHLTKLRKAGIIEYELIGRDRFFRLTPLGQFLNNVIKHINKEFS